MRYFLLRNYEKEVGNVSSTLKEESYKASQLGKTVENLRANQKRLETEMLMKQALEKELTRVQKALAKEEGKAAELEKEVKSKEETVKLLQRNINHLEKRRESSDRVFAALAKEGDKENLTASSTGDLSRQELEAALVTSRPGSRLDVVPSKKLSRSMSENKTQPGPRRQGLSLLDSNCSQNKSQLPSEKPLVDLATCSCDLASQLLQVKTERDAALAKLKATRFRVCFCRVRLLLLLLGRLLVPRQRSCLTPTGEKRKLKRLSAGEELQLANYAV